MSQRFHKFISISRRSCMSICISTCRDYHNIKMVYSLLCGYRISSCALFQFFYSLFKVNLHMFFLKYFFKYSYNIFSIIALWKDAHVFFAFQWYSMGFYPLPHFTWSELTYRVLQKIPSANIFFLKFLFFDISSRYIASSPS